MRNLWRESIAFRRVVAALSVGIAALALSIASNVPQPASLPNADIDQLAMAHANEELRIYQPRIDESDAALSFEGAANVSAEVWVRASLAGSSSQRFGALSPPGPVEVVYAAADDPKATSKDCRTSLTITRAEDSKAPQMLKLWQQNAGQGDQRVREVIVASPETAWNIEVSTDSPPPGQAPCPRVLTLGGKAIPVPIGPVNLLVAANEPIKLIFSSIDPDRPLWSAKKNTFDGLSLGDGDLKADGLDVVSTTSPKTPLLHVVAHKGTDGVTLHDLKIGVEQAGLSVGEDREVADAWKSGKRFPVLDLVDKVEKNPVLASLLAAVLIPGLWKWIQKVCSPKARKMKTDRGSEP